VGELAGCSTFRADGGGGCSVVAGSGVVPAARSVLGTNYDLVITQSSLGAALAVSWQRFVGTILGAAVGAIVASHFGPRALVFGASIFILGLLRAVARLDLSAYRFAGVTLGIILLVPRAGPAWQVALHRFAEVSIGIGVALILAMVWPEREATL
jgi:uncharacterized membrane protein YgaE (UPF0421/DUF939 family)